MTGKFWSRFGGGGDSRRASFLWQAVVYYVNLALNIVNNIVLVPIYFLFFDLETYGAWMATGGFLGALALFEGGFSSVALQRNSKSYGEKAYDKFAEYFGAGLLFIVSVGVLAIVAGVTLAFFIPEWVNAPKDQAGAIRLGFILASVGAAASLVSTNVFYAAVAWQRAYMYSLSLAISSIASAGAALLGLYLGMGVSALGLAYLARGATGMLWGPLYVRKEWRRRELPPIRFKRAPIIEIARESVPVLFQRIASFVSGNMQVTIVSAAIDPRTAGVFAITQRVFVIAQFIGNSIGGSSFSGLAHKIGEAKHEKKAISETVKKVFELFALVALFAFGVSVALNQEFITIWVGPEKFGGARLNALLAAMMLAGSMIFTLQHLLAAFGEFKRTSYASIVHSLIFIGALYFTIDYGVDAIPATYVLAFILTSGWYFHVLLFKQLPNEWVGLLKRFAYLYGFIGVGLTLGYLADRYTPYYGTTEEFFIKAAIYVPIAILLGFIGSAYLRKTARDAIKKLFKR
jgi:O-antigen/teichoic acid export membrane protein